MNQNEAVIRDERERFIEENRKRLMQEEAEKKEKQSKKGYHPLKDLMASVKDKLNQKSLTDVASLNLTDFPEPLPTQDVGSGGVEEGEGEGAAMFSQRENTAKEKEREREKERGEEEYERD